jgi:AraC-like DNA-binding protein
MQKPEECVISASYVALMLRLTRSAGITDEQMLEPCGLSAQSIEAPNATVNGQEFVQLIRQAQKLAADSAFPVHYGLSMSVGTHGMLGFALMTSASVGDALELALRYHKTIFSILDIQKEQHGDRTHYVFDYETTLEPDIEALMTEGIFCGWLSVSRFAMRMEQIECEMRFRSPRPPHAHLYPELFAIEPRFDCQRNELIVTEAVLALPMPAHDPHARQLAEAQCHQALQSMGQYCSLPERVKRILKSGEETLPDLAQVADALHMHPRTLGRRLNEHETCFKVLLDEVRAELAMTYLKETNRLIDDIATSLNYHDVASFYRAFRRWTGHSPGNYRPRSRVVR